MDRDAQCNNAQRTRTSAAHLTSHHTTRPQNATMQTIEARQQTERCKEKLVELADKEKELEAAKVKLDAAIEDLETSYVILSSTSTAPKVYARGRLRIVHVWL